MAAFIAGLTTIQAQEQLSRQDALKYAFIVSADLPAMLKTPIPTDPDVKRPVAMRDGEYGGMVLPESKLGPEALPRRARTWCRRAAVVAEAGADEGRTGGAGQQAPIRGGQQR